MALARAVIALGDQGKGTLSKVDGFRAEMSRSGPALSGIQTRTTESASALQAVADSRRELERAHEALTEFAPRAGDFARFLVSGGGTSGRCAAGSAAVAAADASTTGNSGGRGSEVVLDLLEVGMLSVVSPNKTEEGERGEHSGKKSLGAAAIKMKAHTEMEEQLLDIIAERQYWEGWEEMELEKAFASREEKLDRLRGDREGVMRRARAIGIDAVFCDALKRMRAGASAAVGKRNRMSAHLGERKGELLLALWGFITPREFRADRYVDPGKGHVDGFAINLQRDHVVVPEYKGGVGAEVNDKKLYSLPELGGELASQATPRYVMDRMVQDGRVVDLFCRDEELWSGIQRGEVRVSVIALTTKLDLITRVSHQADFPPVGDPDFKKFVEIMNGKIASLKKGE